MTPLKYEGLLSRGRKVQQFIFFSPWEFVLSESLIARLEDNMNMKRIKVNLSGFNKTSRQLVQRKAEHEMKENPQQLILFPEYWKIASASLSRFFFLELYKRVDSVSFFSSACFPAGGKADYYTQAFSYIV